MRVLAEFEDERFLAAPDPDFDLGIEVCTANGASADGHDGSGTTSRRRTRSPGLAAAPAASGASRGLQLNDQLEVGSG
jgi:hypothetical protein